MPKIQIHKLTPPQITAVRDAFPACVAAGVLTTTRSIATFAAPEGYSGPVVFEAPQIASSLLLRTLRGELTDKRLDPVFTKLVDPSETHVRVLD